MSPETGTFQGLPQDLDIKKGANGFCQKILLAAKGPVESGYRNPTGTGQIPYGEIDPLSIERAFMHLADKEDAGLVMLGKQAIDADNSQIAQMLAAIWSRPQATFASGVTIDGDTARVVREVDAGLETIEVDLPAVISVDLRLNEPRYVKLPDIMKAKKKPLDEIDMADLGIEAGPMIKELAYAPPEGRQRGVTVDDVPGLVAALKDKGLV